jgi:hypothetical protein
MSVYNFNLICKNVTPDLIVFSNFDLKNDAPNEAKVIKNQDEEEIDDLDERHTSSEEEEEGEDIQNSNRSDQEGEEDDLDGFIDDSSQQQEGGDDELQFDFDDECGEEEEECPIVITKKKKKVENDKPTKPNHYLDKALKKVRKKSKNKEKERKGKNKKKPPPDLDNNNNTSIDTDTLKDSEDENAEPHSPLPTYLSNPKPKGKKKKKNKDEKTPTTHIIVTATFPFSINPGFVKMMSCPLFIWNCDFKKEKEGYVMVRVNNVMSYKGRDTFDYSTLSRVAKSVYTNKDFCHSFKSHLKKKGIQMTKIISKTINSNISEYFFPLIRMITVPVSEMRTYFDACRFIFLSYEDYKDNASLLSTLEDELRVEEKSNALQFWNVLKKGKPEDRFRNANPKLAKAWDIYNKLTYGVFAKENVKIPFDMEVHDILAQDIDKFHLEKEFSTGSLIVSLKASNDRLVKFADLLKNPKLTIHVSRVEDERYQPLFDTYESFQFGTDSTYFLVPDLNRAHYMSQEHSVMPEFIKGLDQVPKNCKVLIVDRCNLVQFSDLMKLISELKSLVHLRLYGSFMTPYYEKEAANLIEIFAWKQREGRQNPNVTYESMCSTISTESRDVSFFNTLDEVKRLIKADSKNKYMAFHANSAVRGEYNLKQILLNVEDTTFFNWFEGDDRKKKQYGKALIISKAMDVKKMCLLFNNINAQQIKVFGHADEFFEMLNSVPRIEPGYNGFANYL